MTITELRALWMKATGGVWSDDGRGAVTSTAQVYVNPLDCADKRDREICKCSDGEGVFSVTPRDWHNAELIAAMHTALPELIDELEARRLAMEISEPISVDAPCAYCDSAPLHVNGCLWKSVS